MRIGRTEVKRRVWVGFGCAAVATVAWWSWNQGKRLPAPTPTVVAQPFVRLAGGSNNTADAVLRERADLLDPTPLFFPTPWNYGQQGLPENLRRQPGQVFGSYDPKWRFSEQDLTLSAVETPAAPERLADVLSQGNEAPFAGIGHIDVPRQPLPERSAFVEVRILNGKKPIIEQALTGLSVPKPDYSPIEFIVAVSAAGVIGEPVLARGSGWDEVDAFFRTYLVKTFRVGERLNPGQYRVLIGP